MMIVDDAYIIVGSANINERSMSGTRDTEMAVGCQSHTRLASESFVLFLFLLQVGCWQPQFSSYNPYGEVRAHIHCNFSFCVLLLFAVHQVHMFRMGLWAEHLKTWEEVFRFPSTLECTQRVKEMCKYNWESYNFEVYGMDQMEAPPGHLLLYPVQVDRSGEMRNLDNFVSFPDYPSTAKVMGGKSAVLPEKITT